MKLKEEHQMDLGYSPQTNEALLIATPAEMRALADAMEEKLSTAYIGDSLTVRVVQSVPNVDNTFSQLALRIVADQEIG